MWGFFNEKNRKIARHIYNLIINKNIANQYNKNKNQHFSDQLFLRDYVYPVIKEISIIHDSYLCKSYQYSIPFPTKRNGSCFIGAPLNPDQINNCIIKKNGTIVNFYECPIECRPKEHKDWVFC
jgi:hypothetical protein